MSETLRATRAPGPAVAGRPGGPTRIGTGFIGALNAEWSRLAADPAGDATARAWARTHPHLATATTLADVAALAGRRQHNDAVLATLLGLAQAGDQLAARTVLQVMLGAVIRIAGRTVHHADGDLEEARTRAVAALWVVICEYPVARRSGNHAAGLALDVLSALTRDARALRRAGLNQSIHRLAESGGATGAGTPPQGAPADEARVVRLEQPVADLDPDVDTALLDPTVHPMARRPATDPDGPRQRFWAGTDREAVADTASDEQLVHLLSWAVRGGVLSTADARLLFLLHSPSDPATATTAKDVAGELGLSHAAVRQRASRATRRLTEAVRAAAGLPLDDAGTPAARVA